MNPCDIYITECDLTRLRDVLQARINARVRDRHHLERLQDELDRAHGGAAVLLDDGNGDIPHFAVTIPRE